MKTEREFFVIMTKYGFVKDVYEDYTDINEDNPLSIMYNVAFALDPFQASKYLPPTQSADKYSISQKHHWSELTAEKWAEEIGGKLIPCKSTHENGSGFENGAFVSFERKEFFVLNDEFNHKTEFEEFPYEELESKIN